ncbi:thioredoxin family protein [Spirosoma foliorum]|uniref:Thioredoxin family protein n=2 Tax=Spirosoma foliorum TaxID=2710596 RepID=A0A7G5H158_9BACT|nr:thioredoxin family protein [Spirosoma foliorum]
MMMFSALLITGLLSLIQVGDEPKVHFSSGSFRQILAQANGRHRPVFIDVSTSWCVPCKKMEKEAFNTPSIAQKINDHFIAYKIDAEKGEGELITRKYHVTAYPTLLFLNEDGTLRQKTVGYTTIATLSSQLDAALLVRQQGLSLTQFAASYNRGNRQASFLYAYLQALGKVDLDGADVIDAYIATLPCDRVYAPPTLRLMTQMVSTSHSQTYDLLQTYLRNQGKQPIDPDRNTQLIVSFSTALHHDLQEAIERNDEDLFRVVLHRKLQFNKLLERTTSERETQIIRHETINFYKRTSNFPKYKLAIRPYLTHLLTLPDESSRKMDSLNFTRYLSEIASLPDSIRKQHYAAYLTDRTDTQVYYIALDLSDMARMYLTYATNRDDLLEAINWSKRAVALTPHPDFLITYAGLLAKTGQAGQASLIQKKALDEAKKRGLDSQPYQAALDQFDRSSRDW